MKNKNIIKALAIGISASMALQPVTVLAEGEAVEPVTAKQNDAVDTAAEVVSSDANTLGEDAVKVDAAADVVSEQKKNNVAPTTYDEIKKIENASDAFGNSTDAFSTDAKTLEGDVEVIKTANDNADTAIGSADTINSAIGTLASQTETKMEEAAKELEDTSSKIAKASSVAEANAIYSDAKEIADEANGTYEAAVEGYNELKAQYEAALKDAEAKRQAYEDAYDKADTDLAKAQDDLAKADAAANALKDQAQKALREVNATKAAVDVVNSTSLRAAKAAVQIAEQDVAAKQKAFNRAERAYNNTLTTYNNLQDTIENTKKAIAKNTGDVTKLTLELAEKEAALLQAGQDLKDANSAKTAAQNELNEANKELKTAQTKKSEAEAAQKKNNELAADLDKDIKVLDAQAKNYADNDLLSATTETGNAKLIMDGKKSTLDGKTEAEKEASSAVTVKAGEVTKLAGEIETLNGEVADLTTQVSGALSTKNSLDAEATGLERAASNLETTKKNAQTALKNIADAEEEIGRITSSVSDSQDKLDKLQSISDANDDVNNSYIGMIGLCETLAKTLLEYKLEVLDGKKDVVVSELVTNRNSDSNYMKVSYKDDNGTTHEAYYDFKMQFDFYGENYTTKNIAEYWAVDRITVVEKNPVFYEHGKHKGELKGFNGKGRDVITPEMYKGYLNEMSSLKQTVDNAGSLIEAQQDIINNQTYTKEAAQTIVNSKEYSDRAIQTAKANASEKREVANNALTTYNNLNSQLTAKQDELSGKETALNAAREKVAELQGIADGLADELSIAQSEYEAAEREYNAKKEISDQKLAYYNSLVEQSGVKKKALVDAQNAAKTAKEEAEAAAGTIKEKTALVKEKESAFKEAEASAKGANSDYWTAVRSRNKTQSNLKKAFAEETRLATKLLGLELRSVETAFDLADKAVNYNVAAYNLNEAKNNLADKMRIVKNSRSRLKPLISAIQQQRLLITI